MRTTDKEKIIKEFESVDRARLAKAFKCTRNLIDQYARGLKTVSPLRAKQIEKLTKGKVKASTLRPDVF